MNKNTKGNAKRATKKDIYAKYGIDYRTSDGKIKVPVFGYVKPLMKNGNKKIGKGVFHFSTVPTTTESYTFNVSEKLYTVKGTCACTCINPETGKIDCYACAGHFQRANVRASLGINTFLARFALDFVRRAIAAQIEADNIRILRVHVAGDFLSDEYVNMWRDIATAFSYVAFWTYTKVEKYENAFDDVPNFNVVKSMIKGYGYNFGTCEYIITLYNALVAQGKRVYICLCGIVDDAPHCYECGGCREYDHVLFIKHSTSDYDAKKDPLLPTLAAIARAQKSALLAA